MRSPILAVALSLLASVTFAQQREGTYTPPSGTGVKWSINEHQTLIWNGQPYLPIGVRIDGTPGAVEAAQAAGISDVVVDLPANGLGWSDTFSALEKAKMRYLLRIDSLTPMAKGFAVEPQSYRITGISKPQHITLEIPGASNALVVLATKSDSSIAQSARVPIENGVLQFDAKPGAEVDHILLVYPEMTSIEQPDFWEDLDNERDELLGSLKRQSPGAGLRGVVNPFGRGLALPGKLPRFVPTSPYFHLEFRNYLENKYKNVETLMRNWSMQSSILAQADFDSKKNTKKNLATFDQFAQLIPMWSESRGVPQLYDPSNNAFYGCDSKRSHVWEDISDVISEAGRRRFNRLVPAIRSVVDVPVIQDWLGWAAPYEVPNPMIDGIGMRASGTTQSRLADSGSRASSTVLRWQSHGWLVTTDLDMGQGTNSASQLTNDVDDLESMGAKGIFVRADSPALMKTVAAEAAKRAGDTSPSTSSPLPVFFPENAANPAQPQRLPGGHWWLPCPADGDRVDLGTMFSGYRIQWNGDVMVMWAHKPGRYKLRFSQPKLAHFQTMDGSSPDPKVSKGAVEVTMTENPMIISGTGELPVPELAYEETVGRFRAMIGMSSRGEHQTDEEQQRFVETMTSFDRNPGGCFDALRKMYWKVALKIAPYVWLEASHTQDTNFSEVVNLPGCADAGALGLRTLIPPGPEGYYASYTVPVRSKDDQEVWIAAMIPAERRGDVSVLVGGQSMRITGEPLSLYGSGFGWYKLGTTRIAGGDSKLRVQVDTAGNSEIAIDTILITPGHFQPNGITPPDPLQFATVQIKEIGKKRKGSGGL